ncbi:MAG TPA: tRNA threonylcarbamoyladenosine dehydratase [Chitinophagaceae bacterium]|nr:tRNA threonylcarbamoyladenosine dehydratase [Chitinophagaceae bacterium]HML58005.1 tRNA threonylcarbamoyladenosine dehydratase [Ferruginibacter sp.]
MDTSWLSRTSLLIGEENVQLLTNAHVLIVGMGGVGSYAAEFICRSGVGTMTIIDGDVVDATNRNRQLPALSTNQGQYKADIMAARLMEINPELKLNVIRSFVYPENVESLLETKPDFIIDAIDSISPKLTFMRTAYKLKIPFVSSMGAGAKLDPTQLKVVDISKTYHCPFAQQIRKTLRKKDGIYKGITVVFSPELPIKESLMLTDGTLYKKSAYGTISYLPATFGAVCASVAIRHLIDVKIN